MKIDCKIIEDLVPLYLDEVCSEESRKAIDAHIEKCENCRKLVKGNTEVEIPYIEPAELVKERAVKKGFRKIRIKLYLAILATIVLVSGVFLLEKWCQKQIELEAMSRRSDVEQIEDIPRIKMALKFVDCLDKGDFEGAFKYVSLRGMKSRWAAEYPEDGLKRDAERIFCQLGKDFEEAGGINGYEYSRKLHGYSVGTSGDKTYRYAFNVNYGGANIEIKIDVTDYGVEHLFANDGAFADPFARFGMWTEYIWQEYHNCYFDWERGEYIYYD